MAWRIERDEKGEPVRMHWLGPGEPRSKHNAELERMRELNSLPMPAMREWAATRGIKSAK